jgi:hypothetical protein
MGPIYQADMWTIMEAEPNLRPSDVARRTCGSFATAWQARVDHQVLTSTLAGGRAPRLVMALDSRRG